MNHKKFYIVLMVVFINVVFIGCGKEDNGIELALESETVVVSEAESVSGIYVHISGAVKHPGVYVVEDKARLYQVIELAGGMTKAAKKDLINLAEMVSDGQKIHIMSKKEYKNSQSSDDETDGGSISKASEGDGVNINTASEQELEKLPGIGPSKAAAIVAYREDNGMFSVIEDIKKVSGIGDATFSNIESMITVH